MSCARSTRTARRLASGFSLLEGPRWRGGRLYCSDFYTKRVLAFDPDGAHETIVEVPGQPSGLGWTLDGRLLVVSMIDARLLCLEDDRLREVADLSPYVHGVANDMLVDRAGRAYIGNFGLSRVDNVLRPTNLVCVEPDGSSSIVASDLVFPNGMALLPGGKTLLVAETFAGAITAFDVADDGTLSNRRPWAQFGERPAYCDVTRAAAELPILPDGIALDAEGAVWTSNAKGGGAVRVVEGGEQLDRIDTGDLAVYACGFGGETGQSLYLCAASPLGVAEPKLERRAALFVADVDVPGAMS